MCTYLQLYTQHSKMHQKFLLFSLTPTRSFFPLSDYTTNTTAISIKNTYGRVDFNTTSRSSTGSWGSWSKLFVAAGAIYCYRHELEILARGIVAGARFAVEKWGERHVPRTVERSGEEEDGEGGEGGDEASEGVRCEQVSTCSSGRDRRACPLSMTAVAVLEAGVASPYTVGSEWVEDVVCDDAYLEAMSTVSSGELV
jgi:hypothetical protein